MFQGSCKDLPTPGPPLVLQDGGLVETPRDEAAKEKRTTFMLQKYEVVAILLKATRIVRVVQAITDNTTVALVQSDQKNIKKKKNIFQISDTLVMPLSAGAGGLGEGSLLVYTGPRPSGSNLYGAQSLGTFGV